MATETLTLLEQAAAFHELDTEYTEAAAKAKELKERVDRAEHELFERMEQEKAGSLGHDGVGINFVRAETPYGQVQDRAAFIKWAQENRPELLEVKERKALLNEIAKQHIDDAAPLPPGMGFFTKQYVSQRSR